MKVVPNEECVSQHKLLVVDTQISAPSLKRRKFVPKCRVWKLKQPEFQQKFLEKATKEFTDLSELELDTNTRWQNLKSILKNSAEEICGMSKNHNWRKETWWWNEEVDLAIKEKRKAR